MIDSTADLTENKIQDKGVAGIILAAGRAYRMGRLKQLLPFRGKPLLAHTLAHGAAAGFSPLILVLGCGRKRIQEALPDPPAEIVFNPAWESGIASSIAAGIAHIEKKAPPAAGAFFLLGDQPLVSTVLLDTLLDRALEHPDRIIIPTYRGKRGNPVYFPRAFFDSLKKLSGDRGGSQIFHQFPGAILEVPATAEGICRDIDTPEDYDSLCGPEDL
ncbi:MAG: nucleotidyltransferase family protein [Desulfobacterales bacterium]|nr:nucleotidyltransferase family protein [Desulfobacterales bacterium]